MKSKPNTAQFKLRKDPTAFIEGGEADQAEKPLAAPAPTLTSAAIPSAAEEARRRSRSRATGARITEKDIVVEALEVYLKER